MQGKGALHRLRLLLESKAAFVVPLWLPRARYSTRNVQPNVQLGFSIRTFYRRRRFLVEAVTDGRHMLNKR